jgi:hypothetical protein
MDPAEKSDHPAADLLFGAGEIAAFLSELLGRPVSIDEVYYGGSGRSKANWPIGRLGRGYAASKRALTNHVRKAAIPRPPSNHAAA